MNASKLLSFILFSGFCTLSCNMSAEKEIHLIPYGYTGVVRIFFNQPHGKKEKYENGYRVYEFDSNSNGMLVTQFSLNKGPFRKNDMNFFYIDQNGNRIRIPDISYETSDIQDHTIVRHGGGVGQIGFGTDCRVKQIKYILEYVVDSLKDDDSYPVLNFKCSDLPSNIVDND